MPLNAPQRYICVICEGLFESIPLPVCKRCGVPASTEEAKHCASCFGKTFHFQQNSAAFLYDELMRDMLHEMKFRAKKRVAKGLGFLWSAQVASTLQNPDSFIGSIEDLQSYTLIPMPLHPKKQRERGFNQAEILTRPLSAALQIPMSNILTRTVDTPPQSGLHPMQRAENVSGIFSIQKSTSVIGRNYIITDDIFTTGSSLNECAKTLKSAGATKILCMTLAIAVKNNSK